MNTIVLIYMLLQAKVVAVEAFYSIGLKIVSLPCDPKNCKHMTICYNLNNKCGSDRKTSKICLSNVIDNEININTISAMNGTIGFNVDEVKRDLKIQSRLYLTLNQIGKGDDIYCEESRNVSGNIMAFHLTKLNSFIDIELESVCEEKKCTGFICDRCYDGPPDVNISVIQPVRRDDNVTIVCDISLLTEDTRILWLVTNGTVSNAIYHSDKYNIKTSKSTSSSYLTIYSVQHEDELNYTCQATNVIYTGESSPMQLNVFENPIVNVSHNVLAKAGTNITMWCDVPLLSKATGINWLKNGSIIQITGNNKYGGGTLSSPSLQIFFVQLVDEGNYTCQATNPIGTGGQTVFLAVFSDPIANISNESVIAGSNITIFCNVQSSHIATHVTWLKDGSIIDINSNKKYGVVNFSSPSLEIYYVQQGDEGNYTCQASNSIGIGKSQPVFLIVMSYPVANISDIAPAKAGTNITISCYIPSSSKATHITWVKDDVIINITRNEKFGGGTLSSPSLQIYRLRLADEGNYTCQATNPIGIGRSQPVLLTVISDPPVVSISEIKPAVIGTNITLICNITSFTEEINVTWFKNNVSLNIKHTDKSHFIGGPVFFRTLSINFLEVKDGGDYTCKATNEAGDGLSEPLHLRLFENITKGTSSLHTSGPYIFSSYPSYSPETKHPMESSKTTYLSSAERTIISQSSSKIPVPTSSVKYVEPTNSVQTSATTLINIQPSSTSLTLQANSDNRTNVNAWIITTVVICIVELIVITLVVYIVWLRKKHKFTEEMNRKIREQELAMMDNLTLGTQSVILDNGTYRGTPSYIMDNGTLRTQRSVLPLYATMGRYRSTLIETNNPTSEDYQYTEMNKVHKDNIPVILNGGPRTEPSPVMEHPTPEDNHYTEINKVRRDNIPVVANGSIHSDQTPVMCNDNLISDGKEQTEKEKVSRDESPVIPNKIIYSDQTPVMCNDNLISDGKEQTEKEKVSRDESPVIPNRMLLKEPSDETVNELEMTSF